MQQRFLARRQFFRFLAASPLLSQVPLRASRIQEAGDEFDRLLNVFGFEEAARKALDKAAFDFVADGADDRRTLRANREAFGEIRIRVRRLVDVSRIDTRLQLLGEALESPILLAPIGGQRHMHPEGELAMVRAAAQRKHLPIVSSFSSHSIAEIAQAGRSPLWFQLYPTDDRKITRALLQQAEAAGCRVVALTVDTPVLGNRESQRAFLDRLLDPKSSELGNFRNLPSDHEKLDASLNWDFVGWLRRSTRMKLLIKGIVTREDARLCLDHRVNGIIISNHGGRQEESNRSTIECLPEVVEAVQGHMPVLIDGGFRRGTDIFKALALGASAVCIGRPYVWGLSAFGQAGVEKVLEILQAELIRIMQLAGTPSLGQISSAYVQWE